MAYSFSPLVLSAAVPLQTLEAAQTHAGVTSEAEPERGAGQVSAPVGAVGTSGRGVQLELKVRTTSLFLLLHLILIVALLCSHLCPLGLRKSCFDLDPQQCGLKPQGWMGPRFIQGSLS